MLSSNDFIFFFCNRLYDISKPTLNRTPLNLVHDKNIVGPSFSSFSSRTRRRIYFYEIVLFTRGAGPLFTKHVHTYLCSESLK